MSDSVYDRLQELGITLPPPIPDSPGIRMVQPYGDHLLCLSGVVPLVDGVSLYSGKTGRDITPDQAAEAARVCAVNTLGLLHGELGDLNRVAKFVRMLAFIACDPAFTGHSLVANGCTDLLIGVFGPEIAKPARSAVGVACLPHDFPVEIEFLVEYR